MIISDDNNSIQPDNCRAVLHSITVRLTVLLLWLAAIGFSLPLQCEPFFSQMAHLETIASHPNAVEIPEGKPLDVISGIRDLSILNVPRVREYLFLYMTRATPYTNKAINNSSYYITRIESVYLQYSHLPEELLDLPMLESAFNPYAVSHAGAAGVWQFMPATARGLGLVIDEWQDDRRSIEKSTQAALIHLSDLYDKYHNWDYALAAYNCGSTRIDRAIQNYPDFSYWDHVDNKNFPGETANYVPQFAALSLIRRHSELFAMNQTKCISEPMHFDLAEFTLEYPVHVRSLSETSGIPESVIYFFNPQLKSNVTPLTQRNYTILMPVESIDQLEENAQALYKMRFKYLDSYTVKKGDTLGKIAQRYKVPLSTLADINHIAKPYRLQPGVRLYVPVF